MPNIISFNRIAPLPIALATLILVTSSAGGDNSSSDSNTDADQSNLTLVDVVKVHPASSVRELRRFNGLIESRRNSSLGFERIGRVETISVDEGDQVSKGDMLAELATDKLLAERAKLLADLAMTKAELAELLAGPRMETIAAAKARVEQSESLLEQARKNLKRREQLVKRNLVAAEDLETAQSNMESAGAQVRTLQQQLLELENGTRKEQLEAKRAQIEAIQAAIRVVDADLDNSRIKAPFSGTIVARVLDEGTIVSPGQDVLELAETTKLQARFGIPSDTSKGIAAGKMVEIEIDDRILTGKVKAFVSRVTAATRTQTVLVDFEDPKSEAYDGQVARLLLENTKQVRGFQLPRTALTRGTRGLWNCYVAVGDNAQQRTVQRRIVDVVRTSGNNIIVQGDLAAGDLVIASATHRVTAHQRVRVRETSTEPRVAAESVKHRAPEKLEGGR